MQILLSRAFACLRNGLLFSFPSAQAGFIFLFTLIRLQIFTACDRIIKRNVQFRVPEKDLRSKDFLGKGGARHKVKQAHLYGCRLIGGATTRPHGQGFCTQPSLRAESGVRTPLTGLQDEQSPSEQTLFAEMLLRGQEKRTRNN